MTEDRILSLHFYPVTAHAYDHEVSKWTWAVSTSMGMIVACGVCDTLHTAMASAQAAFDEHRKG
jgi:hypothetical protein